MSFIEDTFFGGAEREATRRVESNLGRAQDFIREGTTGARGELESGFGGAEEAINNALQQALGTQQTGLQDIIGALTGQTGQAIQTLQGAEGRGIESLLAALSGAESRLNPFAQGGEQAFQQQLAFSGALGPEAQAAAYEGFTASPGQEFLRSQGERSITRNAAATGGLGGGALLADLQEFGTGLAAQDFQNQFNRLGQLAGRGQQAATNLGQFGMNTGQNIANLISGTGQGIAGLQSGLGSELARALGTSTSNISNLFTNQGSQLANLRTGLGTNLANLLTGEASNLANLQAGIGEAQAARSLAGPAATRGTLGDLFGMGQTSSGGFDLGTLLAGFGF